MKILSNKSRPPFFGNVSCSQKDKNETLLGEYNLICASAGGYIFFRWAWAEKFGKLSESYMTLCNFKLFKFQKFLQEAGM